MPTAVMGGTEAPSPTPSTRIDVDDDAGRFVFVIEGEPVAILDKTGLHIDKDLTYGGKLTVGEKLVVPKEETGATEADDEE